MVRRRELRRVTGLGALLGVLSMLSGLALVMFGGALASASTGTLDCQAPYGGDYLATVSGNTVTVTLNADCTQTPYYLLVYSASNDTVEPHNPLPADCPNYELSSTSSTIYPTDPNSHCSFPSNSDYPEYLSGSPIKFGPSLSVEAQLPTTPLASGATTCYWQLDVENYFGGSAPSPVYTVDTGLGGQFVWGENGRISCQRPPKSTSTTTTTSTTSTTTTTTTLPTTTTSTTTTSTTTTSTTSTTTTTLPTTTTSTTVPVPPECELFCSPPIVTTTTTPTTLPPVTSTSSPTTTTRATTTTVPPTSTTRVTTTTTTPRTKGRTGTTTTTAPTTTRSTTTTTRPSTTTTARRTTTTTKSRPTTTTVAPTTTARVPTTTQATTTTSPKTKARKGTTTTVASTTSTTLATPPTTVPTTPPTTTVRKLAYTGADIGSMLGLAIALLVSGATLVGLAMWKRREV